MEPTLSFEKQIRHRLGIPDDAAKVLVFSESSHWDPDWLFSSDEYFDRFVRKNLDLAIEALLQEPRRVYSVECIFFLRQYWEHRPEQHETIRQLVNEGRLRLTSSGVTTADTLLPSTEAILRDLLIGQEWLRKNGMKQEPKLAYFPDSFGYTPMLPSILNAAGFDRTTITRIDGMYFMGCDIELPSHFPRPGSSAECLLKQERSLDFIWRDRNGAQVLSHWNAFTYGQGDMLAFGGASRVYLFRFAFPQRSDRHIAHRIHQYVSQLAPLSHTPYMFCPIGLDFIEPIPDLITLLDRYNQIHYPKTGIWVVNAGLDDYLALIESYQDQLPVLELDPNPYWTGFYTARPTLKQRSRTLVDKLLIAEKLSFLPENKTSGNTLDDKIKDAWWQAAVSNHHDFITGTSSDRIVEEEQIPWLEEALDSVTETLNHLSPALPAPRDSAADSKPLTWSRSNGTVQVHTAYYHLELSEEAGGAIVQLSDEDNIPLITNISNDIISYRDSGGLWRMGLEFAGGIWRESMRSSQTPCRLQLHEKENGLEIRCTMDFDEQTIQRKMWFQADSPLIHCRIEGIAPQGHSLTVRFATNIIAKELVMDTSGGIIMRPPKKIYSPTFWPLYGFAHLQDSETGRGLAILQPMPGAISYQPDGNLEIVAMRNATREKIFGLINIPGNPASCHEHESYAFEYTLLMTKKGNWHDNRIHLFAHSISNSPWQPPRETALRNSTEAIIRTDNPDVWVTAIKPASRGQGSIIRLSALEIPSSPVQVFSEKLPVSEAFLCDARERDIKPLEIRDNAVQVTMPGTIATIRMVP